jgi:hypothetical protein
MFSRALNIFLWFVMSKSISRFFFWKFEKLRGICHDLKILSSISSNFCWLKLWNHLHDYLNLGQRGNLFWGFGKISRFRVCGRKKSDWDNIVGVEMDLFYVGQPSYGPGPCQPQHGPALHGPRETTLCSTCRWPMGYYLLFQNQVLELVIFFWI